MAALIFAFGILGASVFKTSALTTSPNYKEVDYFLAYPGILPGHILYPVKMVRDRIWLWLTVDSLRKAEVLLLFADKRLGAGKALIEGGKEELGISTLTKAEKYLERAINQEKIAKEKGKETGEFLEKLEKATLKHEAVLTELEEKVSDEAKAAIKEMLSYPHRGFVEVKQRLGK